MIDAIEITTAVGCPIRCDYCPQDKLVNAYKGRKNMTLATFKAFVERAGQPSGSLCHKCGHFAEPAKERIRVATFFNNAYQKWGNLFLKSLYAHHPNAEVVVMTTDDDLNVLYPCRIMKVAIPEGLKTSTERVTISFATLECFKLEGKWIFCDPDIMIHGSLQPVWESGHFSAALSGSNSNSKDNNPILQGGLFCFEGGQFEGILKYAKTYGVTVFAEQEIITDYFWREGKVKLLPKDYNDTPSYRKRVAELKRVELEYGLSVPPPPEPVVVHWAGSNKYKYHIQYKNEAWKHLREIYDEYGSNCFGEHENPAGVKPLKRQIVTITDREWWRYTAVMLESVRRYGEVDWNAVILAKQELSREAYDVLSRYGVVDPIEKYGYIDVERNPKLYEKSTIPRLAKNLQNPVKFAVPGNNIFMDSDCLVVNSLKALEYYRGIWACYHWEDFRKRPVPSENRMNGGVFLYDGSPELFSKIKEYFEAFPEYNPFGEQYLLRRFFDDTPIEINNLPLKYNRRWGQVDVVEDICIYHFSGEQKPDRAKSHIHEPYESVWRDIHNDIFPECQIPHPPYIIPQYSVIHEAGRDADLQTVLQFIGKRVKRRIREATGKQYKMFVESYGKKVVDEIRGVI